jgi:hypothetical protein
MVWTCAYAQDKPSSGELIVNAWHAHGQKNAEETFRYTNQLIELYSEEARVQQAGLKTLPRNRPDIEAVASLNDVATAHFIQGESYRYQQKKQEAIAAFKVVLSDYCYAQAWDPRGWFWSVAKASRESILKLNPDEQMPPVCPGTEPEKQEEKKQVSQKQTRLLLSSRGKEDLVVNYAKYGAFKHPGTQTYLYEVKDQPALMAAVGEGIYPNTNSVRSNPEYKKAQSEGRLEGSHWDFLQSPDLQAAFFKWATAPEPQGVKMFYTAMILEKAGHIKHAIKAYYSIVVHFPGQYGWTYWHTPWYVGPAAIAKIKYLLRRNPHLGYRLDGAFVKIVNGYDNDVSNDKVIAHPGKFVKGDPAAILKAVPRTGKEKIKQSRGSGDSGE